MLCAITGIAGKPDGTVYASATFIIYRAPMSVVAQDGRVVAPIVASVVSGADGSVALSLLSGNYVGVETASKVTFPFTVPETATADWADCVELAPSVITPTFPASQLTGTLAAAQEPAHTGDVTNIAGSLTLTIAADAVTNAKLANMAAKTIKANLTTGAANPTDATVADVRNLIMQLDLSTRAALVTWAAANTAIVGLTARAAGFVYRYTGTGTAIADLPGWLPFGKIYVDHWAQNLAPSVTNMTAAFQAAVAYLKTTANVYRARESLNCTGSEYMINGQILVDYQFFTLAGDAARGTLIRVEGDPGDVFKFQMPDPTALLGTVNISNISMRSFSTKTNGAAIALYGCQGVWMTNVAVDDFFGGIRVQGGSNQWWSGVTVHGVRTIYKAADMTGSYYVKFEEGLTTTLYTPQNIYMMGLNCEFNDAGAHNVENGIIINASDGLWFMGGHSQGVTSADILVEPKVTARNPSGSQITSIIMNNFWTDSQSQYGIRFRGNSVNNGGHVFTGHRWLSNTVYGVWIEPGCNVGNVTFAGGQIHKAGLSGMRIEDGYSVNISGITFAACGDSLGAERAGVVLAGDARHVTINNNVFTNTVGPSEITLNCGTGIIVEDDTVNDIVAVGNVFHGMTSLWDVDDNKAGSRKVYRNNVTDRSPTNATTTGGSLVINALRDHFFVDASVTLIQHMTHRQRDRVVTLAFEADCTVEHFAPQIYLRGAEDAFFVAGETLTMVYTGSYWREVSRSSDRLSSNTNFYDVVDQTKALELNLAGITTGTTRTLTVPNASGVIATLSGIAQTFENTVLFAGGSGFGYTGLAGGNAAQPTSKSSGVTINRPSGRIDTNIAALGAGASVQFTVTNSVVAATAVIAASIRSPVGKYRVNVVGVAAGSFVLELTNTTAGSLSEVVQINFGMIRASETNI